MEDGSCSAQYNGVFNKAIGTEVNTAQARAISATSYQTPLADKVLMSLSGKLGKEWQQLGIGLGLTRAQLDTIKADYPLQMSNQIVNMLITWRMTQSQDDDVISILAENFESVGRKDLAEEIRQQSSDGFDVLALQAELAEHYLNTICKVPTHPLFPAWVRDLEALFVGLHLIDENGCSSQVSPRFPRPSEINSPCRDADVTHEDLLRLDGPGRCRVLLKGKPGSGKSTLVKKIAYDWSNTQRKAEAHKAKDQSTFSRFALLFPLNLYQMTGSKNLIDAIFDQILPRDTNVSKSKLNDFIKNHQDEVIFLLDGLDEIPANVFETSESDSNLKDVLTGRALRHCLVIVTSRHHRGNQLLKCHPHYAVVETTGFESKGIDEYIQKYFTDESHQTQFISEIQSSHTLRHLAEIPLLLLMMCLVWAEELSLPKRLTELYDSAMNSLLGHLATKQRLQLENLSDVSEGLMRNVGQVALDGLFGEGGEKLVFSAGDFSPDDVDKGCKIGLFVQDSVPHGVKVQSVIAFLHKSFQEFCAASYLGELAETDSQKFGKYLSKVTVDTVGNMEYLFRFCSGKKTTAAELILQHLTKLHSRNPDMDEEQYSRLKLIVAFEAGSKNLIHLLADMKILNLLKEEDFRASRWFHQNLSCPSSVAVLYGLCTSGAEITHIIDILKITPNVERLNVRMNTKGGVKREELGDIPRLERLTAVDIRTLDRSTHKNQLVADFIYGQPKLNDITIWHVSMHGFLDCLVGHVQILKQLTLYNCDLLCEDLNTLCDILSAARNLKHLTLSYNKLNGALRALLPIVPSLEKLDIAKCSFRDSDTEMLSRLLSAANNLIFLNLSDNDLHNHLDILMPVPAHLASLKLRQCSLTDDDTGSLLRLLASPKNLKMLDLYGNNFNDRLIFNDRYTFRVKETAKAPRISVML